MTRAAGHGEVYDVVVVGGGPAGMMAALRAAEQGARVLLCERNDQLGRKLLLTGKGRCNVTNACGLDDFLKRFFGRGDFLRDAFKAFFHQDLIDFLKTRGLDVRVERQQRVFPVTDRASSVRNVLERALDDHRVTIAYGTRVTALCCEGDRVTGIVTAEARTIMAKTVIIATGGCSYKATGSTGDGLRMAERTGHRIVPVRPSLVGMKTRERYVKDLEGITLKNIRLTFVGGKKRILSEIGEVLFTGVGISGPLVISASGDLVDWLRDGIEVRALIDMKPAVTEEQLERRFVHECSRAPRKALKNLFKEFVPQRMVAVLLSLAGIDGDLAVSQAPAPQRRKLAALLKEMELHIASSEAFDTAMVTRGGVSLRDIDPRSMASRRCAGLYFAGEVIDIDGDTGGFNLQAAFSTGHLAGGAAAMGSREAKEEGCHE